MDLLTGVWVRGYSTEAGVTQKQLRRQKTQQGDGSQKLQPWSSLHTRRQLTDRDISPLQLGCSVFSNSCPIPNSFWKAGGGGGFQNLVRFRFPRKWPFVYLRGLPRAPNPGGKVWVQRSLLLSTSHFLPLFCTRSAHHSW